MGYQESWFYMEPQRKFDKLIRAYERAESAGYYIEWPAQSRALW